MKTLLIALIFALSLQICYSVDTTVTSTTSVSEVSYTNGTDQNECAVLVYKCVVDKQEDNGTAANISDALTFTWSVKDGTASTTEKLTTSPAQNYEQFDIITLTGTFKAESYLVVHSGVLTDTSANHTVQCTQAQTYSGTATTGGSYSGNVTVKIVAKTGSDCSTGPAITIDQTPGTPCALSTFIEGGIAADDKMLLIGDGQTMTAPVAGPATPVITDTKKVHIIAQQKTNTVQSLYTYTFALATDCGLSVTDVSGSTDKCDMQILSLETDKDANATTTAASVTIMDGTTALAAADFYAVEVAPSATGKVKYTIIVKPQKFTVSTTATFTIGIKQSSASGVIGAVFRSVKTVAIGTNSDCSGKAASEMSGDFSSDCSYSLTGSAAGVWTYYGAQTVTGLPASGSESKTFSTDKLGFYVNTITGGAFDYYNFMTAPGNCVKIAQTTATQDRCADFVLTCNTNISTPTYAWTSTATLASTVVVNQQILTIPANTLADKTAKAATCTIGSDSDTFNIDNIVETTCSSAPAPDDDDDDNSSILSTLVLALLAFLL